MFICGGCNFTYRLTKPVEIFHILLTNLQKFIEKNSFASQWI
jgi:hypothetical protein